MGWGEKPDSLPKGPPPRGGYHRVRSANELLVDHVRQRAAAAGVPWDEYHADFLVGVVTTWLGERDAVLTSNGVRKGSDWRKGELE